MIVGLVLVRFPNPIMADPIGRVPPGSSVNAVPPGWQAFASPRYGYEVSVPADWQVVVVPGSGGLHPEEPGLDSFLGPNRQLGIAAVPVATTLDDWTSPITAHYETLASDGHALAPDTTEPITIDGRPARLATYHFAIPPYVTLVLEAELVVDGRGYMLTFLGLAQQDAADRELFLQMLEGFRLTGG